MAGAKREEAFPRHYHRWLVTSGLAKALSVVGFYTGLVCQNSFRAGQHYKTFDYLVVGRKMLLK